MGENLEVKKKKSWKIKEKKKVPWTLIYGQLLVCKHVTVNQIPRVTEVWSKSQRVQVGYFLKGLNSCEKQEKKKRTWRS